MSAGEGGEVVDSRWYARGLDGRKQAIAEMVYPYQVLEMQVVKDSLLEPSLSTITETRRRRERSPIPAGYTIGSCILHTYVADELGKLLAGHLPSMLHS